jgi:hypothetical protein
MSERFSFTVDRSKWRRGKPDSALLGLDGNRCCLGFLAQACGIQDDEMQGEPCPSDVVSGLWPEFLLRNNGARCVDSSVGKELMDINDSHILSEEEREHFLVEKLSAYGIDVTFIDGPGEQP